MPPTRCVHGIDSRFCSICNRRSAFAAPRGAISSVTLPDILEFLEAEQLRAAPRAIAEVIGVDARTLAAQLGGDSAGDGVAPDITSGTELLMRLTTWKAKRSSSAT